MIPQYQEKRKNKQTTVTTATTKTEPIRRKIVNRQTVRLTDAHDLIGHLSFARVQTGTIMV